MQLMAKGRRSILVSVSDSFPIERAVDLACRLGLDQAVDLVLVYVVEVPLTLPLSARMPLPEAAGIRALRDAESTARGYRSRIRSRLVRARRAADAILTVAEEEAADVIVIGAGVTRRVQSGPLGQTADEVLRRARCQVVVVKTSAAA